MATNKRKDAAALFELIDKSTLKVPKHAGSLKIPDWWSSKTNPAPEPAKTTGDDDLPLPGLNTTTPPAQARLFEPPPAGSVTTISPSIRPPAANGTSRASIVPSPATIPPAAPTTVRRDVLATDAAVAKPDRLVGARIFAPQTMEQGGQARTPWGGQHKRRMARVPRWMILAVVGVIVLIVLLIVGVVWIAKRHGSAATTSGSGKVATLGTSQSGEAGSGTVDGGSILPPPRNNNLPTMPMPRTGDNGGDNTAPPGEGGGTVNEVGKVYAAGTVARAPDQYYIMISSTPTASVAQKNAEFLAKHGVDVSIEVVAGQASRGRWYKLISVKGFPTMVAAEPFRKQIVLIGHETLDFKNHKKVWDDAFVTRVTTVAK